LFGEHLLLFKGFITGWNRGLIVASTFFVCCVYFNADECGASEKKPSMFVPDVIYEFFSVPAGRMVVHDFVIQNRGAAPLLIHDVESDCGCTAVAFTKSIPPNREGKITVKLDTISYGGNHILKYVEVFSNDPQTPELSLTMEGTVDKFVDIKPLTARLKGPVGKSIKTDVIITPSKKYPFEIIEIRSRNGDEIQFALTSAKNKDGSFKYVLSIENVKKSPGRYIDVIYLKTDSTVQQYLKVFVSGDVF